MTVRFSKAYWIDELAGKHEAYGYDDSRTRTITVEHEGRSVRVLMPDYTPPTTVKLTAAFGNLLFLIGEQMENEDDEEFEEGYGIVMVARRHPERNESYWLVVNHKLANSSWRRL